MIRGTEGSVINPISVKRQRAFRARLSRRPRYAMYRTMMSRWQHRQGLCAKALSMIVDGASRCGCTSGAGQFFGVAVSKAIQAAAPDVADHRGALTTVSRGAKTPFPHPKVFYALRRL